MEWSDAQHDDIVNQAMDLCTNINRFRQVIILTMATDGTMNVIQKRRDDATAVEALGMYRLMAADVESQLIQNWHDTERPCSEDEP